MADGVKNDFSLSSETALGVNFRDKFKHESQGVYFTSVKNTP